MQTTIQSRILGRTLTFSRPGQCYVFVDVNGQPGTLGQQCCDGGYVLGSTMTFYGEDQDAFARVCRRWYRAYLRHLRT